MRTKNFSSLLMIITIAMVMFTGCSKDDEDTSIPTKTYQITNNMHYDGDYPELDGTMYAVVVSQCKGGVDNPDIIKMDHIKSIASGAKSEIIQAKEECEYVIVTFLALPDESKYAPINKRLTIAEKFYLKENKTVNIVYDEKTTIGR